MGGQPCVAAAGLDGSGRVLIAREGLLSPSGLALDQHAERLYWCDLQRGAVESADLDGSNRHTLTQTQVGEASVSPPHIHTHTHTHTHVYISKICMQKYTLRQRHTHTNTHTHIWTCMCTQTHSCTVNTQL